MVFKQLLCPIVISLLCCFLNQGSSIRIGHKSLICKDYLERRQLLSSNDVSNTDTNEIFSSQENNFIDEDRRWDRVIPTDLDSLWTLSDTVQRAFSKAVSQLEDSTCLKFVMNKKVDESYIYFTNKTGPCVAKNFGKIKGQNIINLGPNCTNTAIIIREIMHILGFEREHQRPDRDEYITIEKQNIRQEREILDLFEKSNRTLFDMCLPYDFSSITHFDELEYSANNKPTITSNIHEVNLKEIHGRHLSSLDKFKINFIMQCYEKFPGKY